MERKIINKQNPHVIMFDNNKCVGITLDFCLLFLGLCPNHCGRLPSIFVYSLWVRRRSKK